MPSVDPTSAVDLAVRLAAVGFTLSGLEQLVVRNRAFGPTGPFSEAMARVYGRGVGRNRMLNSAFYTAQFSNVGVGVLLVTLGTGSIVSGAALASAVIGNVIVRLRRITASDGAEQMTILIFLAALLGTLYPTPHTVAIVATFIAAQTLLCYLSAGLAKSASHTWREGKAVTIILGSQAHGHRRLARALTGRPPLGHLLAWSVMTLELSFILVCVTPQPIVLGILIAGLGFHLGCAMLMGLNSFVWAFPATYACVFWLANATPGWR
jgi:hypothetical protein